MKVGICDAEALFCNKHRFPNLVSEKIASYCLRKGYDFDLIIDKQCDLSQYDKVYLSKVFTNTQVPGNFLSAKNVVKGGTGFYFNKAPKLPDKIEHCPPYYDLYNEWIEWELLSGKPEKDFKYYRDYSIGFVTRGCFRGCEFCVNQDCTKVIKHSPLMEFLDSDRKKICLLDDNFFGYPGWKNILLELRDTGKPFQFKQGLDERLLTREKCEILFSCKYDGEFIFAFDNIDDRQIIEEKLKLIKSITDKRIKFYVLVGFDRKKKWDSSFWIPDIESMFERIKILFKYECAPYIMRYENCYTSEWNGLYTEVSKWCNQPSFMKKFSLSEFIEMDLARRKDKENSIIKKTVDKVMRECPDIYHRYFNMKFERYSV